MSRRSERLNEVLRNEIGGVVRTEVRDPRVGLASVTSVDVTHDLSHAVVRVSVLGDDDAREASIEALRNAKGFIRSVLARRLRDLRTVPELKFELDRGAEHSQRISDLLESLNDDDEQRT